MLKRLSYIAPVAAGFALMTSPAFAHTFGAWGAGFPQGFMHPMMGADHMLAMTGVGFWAGRLGGRATWVVPLSFVAAMVLGGALGLSGLQLPMVEFGIAGSIVLLGVLIALRSRLPMMVSSGTVGAFAIFHGIAHGAEAPEAASPVLYCLGFLLATALLHAVGIGLAHLSSRVQLKGLDRMIGAGTAVLGLGLLMGS
jgi:urease accessory protein